MGRIQLADGGWHIEERAKYRCSTHRRGDGFVGGLLYGILRGWEPERCLQFGWAAGALATTMLADYATPADEEQVWSVYKGNARVRR
jgi:2-dehydro-3-deoxygluconokinase